MIKKILAAGCWLLSLTVLAQKTPDPRVFAKTITGAELKKHLSIIAGAEMEGRNTPSPGLEKAANYIEAQFKKVDLKPGNKDGYRQYFTLQKDSATGMQLSIGGNTFTAYTDYAPWISMPAQADLKFSEYTFVGYGIVDEKVDDYKGADVKGRLVIFLAGQPEGYTTNKSRRQSPAFTGNKIKAAQSKGAAAVLIVSDRLPDKEMLNSAYRPVPDTAVEEQNNAIPVLFIGEKVVNTTSGHSISDIKSGLGTALITPTVNSEAVALTYSSGKKTARVSNVIGIVEGTDKKDEYLFVTAHYDHEGIKNGKIYYGADDDGSGTVSVIKLAEAFAKAKKAGKGPRRTVVFMTVSGEEKGLWGSEYYSEHPIFPTEKTTADLNIDMIGRTDTERMSADTLNYIYVIGHNKLSTDLPAIIEGANNKYTKLVLDYKFDDPNDPNRIYYRSDHYNFAKKGIPILFFYDGMLKADYHQPTDTVDKINFPLMERRAQLIFYAAWEMANRNAMLKRDLKLAE